MSFFDCVCRKGVRGGIETTVYDGLTVTVTNALDQTQERRSNAIDYAYDAFGNLVETDAVGTVTTMDYDLRGLKTGMSDPDMGVWSYDYDRLGQLVSQTDAPVDPWGPNRRDGL